MSQVPTGPSILGTKPRIGRTTTALRLPSTPSAAFEDFIDPFKDTETKRGLSLSQRFVPLRSELSKVNFIKSFQNTNFIGPRGDFARNVFNVKTKKRFGPQNLPAIRRRKSLMEFEF